MTQFALTSWQEAKALHVNKREENHGDDLVDAMDLKLRFEFANIRLDEWFGSALRLALYKPADSQTLDGVEETTPDKRTDLIESPHKLKTELAGYVFQIRRGMGKSKRMEVELPGADAKSFQLDLKTGGTCVLTFTVRVSALDEEMMGRIASMGGRDVEILMIPPALQEGTLPESHTTGKKAKGANPFKYTVVDGETVDNNPADADAPDATDIFAQTHGAPTPDADADPFGPAAKRASKTVVKKKPGRRK
jgi:hypothetical protein